MKPLRLAATLALGVSALAFAQEPAAESFDPKPLDIARYEPVWKRSPFIVETVAVPVSQGLASRFGLVGLVTIGAKPTALLLDRTPTNPNRTRFLVAKGTPSEEGVELLSTSSAEDLRKASVVIRLGGQQATLTFDPQVLGQMGNGGGGEAAPMPAPAAGQPPAVINPARPGLPAPASANGATPNPGAVPPAPPPRRIIRPAPINVN